jgi:hypothetical protein
MSTKIQFSAHESTILKDAALILTKNRIILKVQELFGNLSTAYLQEVANQIPTLPTQVLQWTPKISKGEQYKQLPYVMLDYPRFFSKEDVFAIRTFLWWGNHCSVTLHLKGLYLEHFLPLIKTNLKNATVNSFKFAYDGDEWNHDLSSSDYSDLKEDILNYGDMNFLKIGNIVELEHLQLLDEHLLQVYKELMGLLKI